MLEETLIQIVVIVVCYAVAIVIVKRTKGRKSTTLLDSLTSALLALVLRK